LGAFIVKRLLTLVPTTVAATLLVFLAINVLPGDPAVLMAGDQATKATVSQLRRTLGLDRPLVVRYGDWIGSMARGDFGNSLLTHQPVRKSIVTALPITLELAVLATILMVAAGITIGGLAASFRGSPIDAAATGIASLGIALPNFWLAMLLVYGFSLKLGLLPAIGFTAMWSNPGRGLRYAILPTVTLAAPGIAILTRQTRSALQEVLSQDYVRTAQAKGLRPLQVLIRHALRNALLPIIAMIGLQMSLLIGGSVIVETVFAVPGMGRLIVNAIFTRDYPVVQGVAVVIVVFILLLNVCVDFVYTLVDPRIRLGS
jgi:peptide/nickel transport system permease protein